MIPSISNPQTTPRNQIEQISSIVDDLNSLVFGIDCQKNYNISDQIPLWVVYEKNERIKDGENPVSVFDFIQKYYDWLYCDNTNGAQYELSAPLLDLIDIDKTKSSFLQRLAQIYASGFDPKYLETNGGPISEENLRKFLKNIKTNVYLKKTTEDSIRYFFISLFGLDEEDISIEVPKRIILRLNGGKFFDTNFSFLSGGTGDYLQTNALSGSYLNGSRIQDGNWIQDWSYLIKTGIKATSYKEIYKEMMHPAGLKVVYEHVLSDYQGSEFDETNPYVCEYPLLRNYSGYTLGFDYSNSTSSLYIADGWSGGVEGITFVGVPYQKFCSFGNTGFCGPTHLFPNWAAQNDIFNFFDLNINSVIEMCYPIDYSSPNAGVSCSNFIVALP